MEKDDGGFGCERSRAGGKGRAMLLLRDRPTDREGPARRAVACLPQTASRPHRPRRRRRRAPTTTLCGSGSPARMPCCGSERSGSAGRRRRAGSKGWPPQTPPCRPGWPRGTRSCSPAARRLESLARDGGSARLPGPSRCAGSESGAHSRLPVGRTAPAAASVPAPCHSGATRHERSPHTVFVAITLCSPSPLFFHARACALVDAPCPS